MAPTVSVILPVRNGGRFLTAAVASILAQDHTDLELIVVDDHGSDGAIARLPRDDARQRLVANAGRGLIDALNTGIAAARGAFLARMDADDVALPGRLGDQLGYLADHPEVAIAGGCVEIFGDRPIAAGNRRYQAWLNSLRSPEDIRRELFVESPLPHPTWVMRRRVLATLGGYRDAGWPEDYDLLLRADAAGLRFGKPEAVVLRWREHPGRLTRADARYDRARFTAAKAHFLAQSRLDGRPVVIWGAGPGGSGLHDALRREQVPVLGFLEVHPRRIGGTKRGLPVWHFADAARDARGAFVLVAVGVPAARPDIRRHLQSAGRREGEDWLFAA